MVIIHGTEIIQPLAKSSIDDVRQNINDIFFVEYVSKKRKTERNPGNFVRLSVFFKRSFQASILSRHSCRSTRNGRVDRTKGDIDITYGKPKNKRAGGTSTSSTARQRRTTDAGQGRRDFGQRTEQAPRALRCTLVAGESMGAAGRVGHRARRPDAAEVPYPAAGGGLARNRDLPQRDGRCAGRAKGAPPYASTATRYFGYFWSRVCISSRSVPDASIARIRTRVPGRKQPCFYTAEHTRRWLGPK